MLVGLTGPSGSRKTQVAKHLQRAHGFTRIHAGAPAKAAIRAASGMTRKQVRATKHSSTLMLGGADSRQLHEAVSAAMHSAAPELTSIQLLRRVAKLNAQGKNVVVDGVRSPVEAATLERVGGVVARVDNGKPIDPEKPMDRMQATVKSSYTIDTSSGKKADRQTAADRMLDDLRSGTV
jgi:dephospho-CoA kinase